ncbi:MAG TPA: ABC transporter ATP-binding protein, partial [Thermomicrobiales bacterium]|nr:ABC transporter ATP-binding protein [Thermomicrobiales bacterium]
MATLRLELLNLIYGGKGNPSTHAVRDVDLVVGDGEFCVFLGPSGCGKTSTLRMIAGLETPTSGIVRLDGRVINDLYPGERDIAMVFQSYALYPHLTVRGHLELPLKAQRVQRAERERRVNEIADLLQITDLLESRPRQLSGGQAQRTAIGRALIRQPRLFLLDEPLTNLDARLRLETRAALKRLQNELGITTIYVTHDQEEALSL